MSPSAVKWRQYRQIVGECSHYRKDPTLSRALFLLFQINYLTIMKGQSEQFHFIDAV